MERRDPRTGLVARRLARAIVRSGTATEVPLGQVFWGPLESLGLRARGWGSCWADFHPDADGQPGRGSLLATSPNAVFRDSFVFGAPGVFAPHSSWRKFVVPASQAQPSSCRHHDRERQAPADKPEGGSGRPQPRTSAAGGGQSAGAPGDKTGGQAPAQDPAREAAARAAIQCPEPQSSLEPSPARPSHPPWRLDWATLLSRIHRVDALKCPECGGRLRFIAVITETDTAKRILDSMGLPSEPPPVARARAPDYDLVDLPPPDWD